MSKDFYSYMYGGCSDTPAMDAEVMRLHPDGSPCYAKREEDCPILGKSKKADEADDLNNSEQPKRTDVGRHLAELKSIVEDPEVAQVFPAIGGMTFSELEASYQDVSAEYDELENTMGDDYQKGTRAIADKIAADKPEADYDTFGMDGHNRNPELKELDAWGVTFNTSKMDDPSHKTFVDDANYDKKVAMLTKVSGAEGPHVGIFQHKPEISVACEDTKKAIAQMVMFEQCGIYNYKYGRTLFNPTYSEEINPGLERENKHVVEGK